MNLEYRNILNTNFHPASRVWVYQSNRLFTMSEALEAESILQNFVAQWQSHGSPVGCSTDTSVRLIKDIAKQFNVSLFDRTHLAFVIKDKIQVLPMNQIQYAAQNGFIDDDTLYFNNIVQTKKELEENWIIPVKNSWLASKISKLPKSV